MTIILLLTISFQTFACECPEYELNELDNESYKWSDLIVIGNVIKTGMNYKISVTETLKGEIENQIIYGTTVSTGELIDTCSFFPKDKGKYLLYLKRTERYGQPFYLYSQCLGTRLLSLDSYPISLMTDKSKSELVAETENWIKKLRNRKK